MNYSKDKNELKNKKKSKAIAILGPTSAGKTSLAVNLALHYRAEIISADSRQVYKGMDIGTGKDLSEYIIEKNGEKIKIPYHLIDVCSPSESFNLSTYLKLANQALDDLKEKKVLPMIVGGSGLYLEALIENYQISSVKQNVELRKKLESLSVKKNAEIFSKDYPKFFEKLNNSDRNNKRRLIRYLEILNEKGTINEKSKHPKFEFLVLGVNMPRKVLRERIKIRLKNRIEKEKMIEEVKHLHNQGLSWERLESFGLEYRYVSYYLQGSLNYEDMFNDLYTASCRFAKRQMSWFRRLEKQGRSIYWINNFEEAKEKIDSFINN